jgi:hypothetical protein
LTALKAVEVARRVRYVETTSASLESSASWQNTGLKHTAAKSQPTDSSCAALRTRGKEEARYDRYVAAFMPVLRKYGGRLLAADERPEVVEGQWAATRSSAPCGSGHAAADYSQPG